jgi:hypothetical protein
MTADAPEPQISRNVGVLCPKDGEWFKTHAEYLEHWQTSHGGPLVRPATSPRTPSE